MIGKILHTIGPLSRAIGQHNACQVIVRSSGVISWQSRQMSSQATLDISGVYPPIATPFSSNEDVDFQKLKGNIEKWNQVGFRGYVVQGSNGECAYLTFDEKVDIVKKVREWAPKEKLIIAGSGLESTRHTIELSKAMAGAGADALLVVTPCYYKGRMTNQALISHYNKVADVSPVPVILYSVPGNTGIDLAPEVIIQLAAHPNIIGLKDSGGDIAKLANLVYKTQKHNFQILAGSASFMYPALSVGCVGGVCALSNVLGAETVELQTLYQNGKHTDAQKLQHRLVAPNAGVTKLFGVSGLKAAMEWAGLNGGPVRSPLLPLNQEESAKLKQIFNDSGFLKS